MDPIEKAIRNALEKGDVDDPDFRRRIYASVEAALDRAIQANPQTTVERAIQRRRQLQEKIAEIESEFQPALPAADAGPDDANLDSALLEILARGPQPPEPPPFAPTGPAATPSLGPAVQPPVGSGQPVPPVVAAPSASAGAAPEPVLESLAVSIDPVDVGPAARPAAPEPEIVVVASPDVAPQAAPAVEIAPPAAAAPRGPEPTIDIGMTPASASDAPTPDFPSVVPPPPDDVDVYAPVPESPPEIIAADRMARSKERRRPFAALFFGITLLSIAGVGLVFAFQTGLLKSPAERDTSVHNPPATLPGEDFDPGQSAAPPLTGQETAQPDWSPIFSPDNPGTASAPSGATAEPGQDDTGAFLRVRSGAGDSAIVFDIGQDVLQKLAGKKAVFSISARAEEGKNTEISVECNFGELGDCGRKRYEAGYEKAEYLFEIDLPAKAPGASGTIAINSDVSGSGKAADIYLIRAAAQ